MVPSVQHLANDLQQVHSQSQFDNMQGFEGTNDEKNNDVHLPRINDANDKLGIKLI